jgi:DNA-binding CsgD family transcriptional regulator
MSHLPDLQEARRRLGLALDALNHDRWVLGYVRDGWLQPIAASEVSRRFLRRRQLAPLSRRALYERRPMVVNSVIENPHPSNGYDWELDWPAVVYGPVGEIGRRPVGLLVLGCRRDHWYTEEDIAYVHSLGVTLGPMVTALREPLGRLSETENEVAQLLSYGLSAPEIARAMRIDERRAKAMAGRVARKLESVSADRLAFPVVRMRRREFWL